MHGDFETMAGPGPERYGTSAPRRSGDSAVLRGTAEPFAPESGLRVVSGSLGRAVIKVSTVVAGQRVVSAPARNFEGQARAPGRLPPRRARRGPRRRRPPPGPAGQRDAGAAQADARARRPAGSRPPRGAGEAVRRIAREVPGAVVGAGTVLAPADVAGALEAGATFLVSPGATPALLDALQASGAPFLAGMSTASDVVALLERGIPTAKLFPARPSAVRLRCGRCPGRSRSCAFALWVASTRPVRRPTSRSGRRIGGSWIADAETICTRNWHGRQVAPVWLREFVYAREPARADDRGAPRGARVRTRFGSQCAGVG